MDNMYSIITGSNRGIGRGIALGLAKRNKAILMACRNIEFGKKAAYEILRETGNKNIEVKALDLASFGSIREFISFIRNDNINIEALINNAGILAKGLEITEDGYEKTMQVNYLGPALLTMGLLGNINDGNGKVLNTSSVVYKYGTIDDSLFNPYKKYNKFKAYSNSKLAFLYFSLYLKELVRDRDIAVASVDPGIVNTNILSMNNKVVDALSNAFFRPLVKDENTAARIFIRLCVDYSNNQIEEYYVNLKERALARKYADQNTKEYVWDVTKRVLEIVT